MSSNNSIRIFRGAVAIITGGASGIGKALAEELAKRGCEVVLADRQIERAGEVAAEIRSAGGRATAIEADVTDFPAIERLVNGTAQRTGRLDYMFNNAGIGIGGLAADFAIADWNEIIDVNLRGVIHGAHAAGMVMLRQGYGHIVNTSSLAGLMPSPGTTAYSTTKHAVVGLSKGLRGEMAHAGVRVSVLCPGVVRTPLLDGCGKYGKLLSGITSEQVRLMWESLRPMPADVFAVKVIDAVAKNKPIIIVPAWWKVFWLINRFFPSFGLFLAEKAFMKMKKEMAPAAGPARLRDRKP
jgi:NAD(P)-dependent dehydrogenase (short-subunit alcohol dehydrogenase family)